MLKKLLYQRSRKYLNHLEAHLFAGGGRELKDNYLPEVDNRLPYERWNFIKIPPLSKGYLYNSLIDTPLIEPMFLSFEVDYNTVQSSQTQRAFDLNMDYYSMNYKFDNYFQNKV